MAARSRAKESKFQSELIKELREMFPGCIILKNDPNYQQGIPDLLILFRHMWAVLEAKRSEFEERQPNQDYYIDLLGSMSFAAFIYPENKEEVLNALQQTFGTRRSTRSAKRQ